jgi:protein-disulfide isomerase
VKIATTGPVQPALAFEDPLCPTCRAFHQRLAAEGIMEQLDYQLALFPLDNECNWMLDRPLHPGACTLSKALLCADETGKGRLFLDWAYEEQEQLATAGKAGKEPLLAKVRARFPGLDACVDDKKTKQRLDAHLRFAVANKIKVSTPQLFLGGQRVCDEDTDLGLRFAFAKLAPKVR